MNSNPLSPQPRLLDIRGAFVALVHLAKGRQLREVLPQLAGELVTMFNDESEDLSDQESSAFDMDDQWYDS